MIEKALELACDDLRELREKECDNDTFCDPRSCPLKESCDADFSEEYYIRKARGLVSAMQPRRVIGNKDILSDFEEAGE